MTLAALSCLVAPTALAAPLELSHQGRLLDGAGAPLDGSHDLSLALYPSPAGGVAAWSDTFDVTFDAGYFSVVLGSGQPLDSTIFDGAALYLGLAVAGSPELPVRVPVTSVPYAIRATTARDVVGGTVDATEVRVDGTTIIDGSGQIAWSHIADPPVDADTLAELDCSGDQVARHDGGGWTCADGGDHAHNADAIASGTIDVNRLPVGTSDTQVAAGDHAHSAADVGALPAGGSIPVGEDTASCSTSIAGTIRYNAGVEALEWCDGSEWSVLMSRSTIGSSSARPAQSCKHILQIGASSGDGVYWIDPSGSNAYQAYCDMTTAGGGWTLLMRIEGSTRQHVESNAQFGPTPCEPDSTTCKLSTTEITALTQQPGAQIFEVRPDNASYIPWYVRSGDPAEVWPSNLECSNRVALLASSETAWILTSYRLLSEAEAAVNGDLGTYTGSNHHYPTPYSSEQLFFKGSGNGIRANSAWSGSGHADNQPATLWVR